VGAGVTKPGERAGQPAGEGSGGDVAVDEVLDAADVDSELAKLDADDYRPLPCAGAASDAG